MKRITLFALAFIAMTVAAFASLVRFGGHREGGAAAVAASPARPAPVRGVVVPVAGVSPDTLADTWGQARSQGRSHQGIDIMAPGNTPVLAAADGVVEKLFLSKAGGLTLYQRSRDRLTTYYYAHLAGYAPGIAEGSALRAGQQIGFVGDTGNAGKGNTHLHFGITRTRPNESWWDGQPVNPYPLLAPDKGNR